MTHHRCGRPGGGLLFVSLLALLFAFGEPRMALAQQDQGAAASDAITPVEEYARQVDQLKKSYPELAKRIEQSAKAIDELTDVGKARQDIEELRGMVAEMLGTVTDNGVVSELGQKALAHAQSKLKQLQTESRFQPEERAFLIDLWGKIIVETERATNDLEGARKEFAELLRTLQTREDYVDELMQVRRAAEAIKVMRALTQEIRDASLKLKTLIGGLHPPGV
jgi:DNA repair exonuclease SbcCD ATPase subunit